MRKFLLSALSILLLVSFSSCKDGKGNPRNARNDILTISGVITTDKDLEAEGLTTLTAMSPEIKNDKGEIIKPREILGECRIYGKTFTITLKTPKYLARFSDDPENNEHWSNPDVGYAFLNLVFLNEEREKYTLECERYYQEGNKLVDIEMSFFYVSDDVTGIIYNASVKFKKGWNIAEDRFIRDGKTRKQIYSTIPYLPTPVEFELIDEEQ